MNFSQISLIIKSPLIQQKRMFCKSIIFYKDFRTGHLSRGYENIIDSTNFTSFCYSLDSLLLMYKEEKYKIIFDTLKLCLENLIDHISTKYKSKEIKERLKLTLNDEFLNFNCFYNGLKISEVSTCN